ncbi:SRPBCC domain-containing protein [Mucilaginibacter sp. Bleaf8]|uniref:SRPBCC family protein n=1 Tax=Mucilaginibacter sp. Bleaf8 TaxID=2834430 RepID=UPI001BCE26AD|nr:SRPBCC family protein [Mucilaginibacter sp. Bleaf8]MBS7564025.1 SRPBCC domain-containing protein [Mucilaginibacter sp. Bleaf8]
MENNALKLGAEKDFAVPVERLYQAWISEDDLKQWWKPSENHLVSVENDVREGGQVRYVFAGKNDETDLVITGEYKEVKENEKLVYTWNWDVQSNSIPRSDHELTIEFIADGDNSKLRVSQENKAEDESVKPHEHGWEKSLNDLQAYLSK